MKKYEIKNNLKNFNENHLKINVKSIQLLVYFLIIIINLPLHQLNEIKEIYKKFIKEKNKYIDNCNKDDIYKYEYKNICYISCPKETHISLFNKYLCESNNLVDINNKMNKKEKYKKIKFRNLSDNNKDNKINYIRSQISTGSDEINNLINGNSEDIFDNENKIIYQITSTYNQKNQNKNNNKISTIILGECENKLKEYNNINKDIPLLIFKVDFYEEGMLIPIIEYEVYDYKNKQKLQLDICEGKSIKIVIPLMTEEESCVTLCDDNCIFLEYDSENKKYICQCQIKKEMKLIFNMKFKNGM